MKALSIHVRRLSAVLTIGLFCFLGACQKKKPTGFIEVRAPNAGVFEIYRIDPQHQLQFVSEQIGHYNETITLATGEYLILADCSFERIRIQDQQKTALVAHRVVFLPPKVPSSQDRFSIQCDRFSKTRSRQHLNNRFELNILDGHRELLVGMVPIELNLSNQQESDRDVTPSTKTFHLAGVKVNAYQDMPPKTSYFVSPIDAKIAVTTNQEFGHWLFLLPGSYHVEVNGTQLSVDLQQSESRTIEPAFLRIAVDPEVNLQLSSSIVGTPLYVELNENHWLDLNRIYPLLPGDANIKLNGSQKSYPITLTAGELLEKTTRSVVVSFNCPPWEWVCLGGRKIFLYNTDKAYPFAEGVSDVPLLFFEEDAWLSIQGSRDIRYKLRDDRKNHQLKVGVVHFVPDYQHRPNQITDLTRVEAINTPFTGHTLDLPIERPSTVPLIAGSYHLAQYISNYAGEYERRPSKRWLHVKPFSEQTIHFQVLVSEKKLSHFKKQQQRRQHRQSKKRLSAHKELRPIIPIEVF